MAPTSLLSARASPATALRTRSSGRRAGRSAALAVRAVAEDLRPAANNGAAKYRPGTQSVHGGEREGRPRVSDSLTTPIVQTSTYTFKDTAELIAYQEGTYGSYEYGRWVC